MNVAVVGCGRIGAVHARNVRPLATTLFLVDPDDHRTTKLASDLDAIRLQTLATAPLAELDAAIVATPTPAHHPAVRRLLEARIPTFCEKPLALTLEETKMMGRLADQLRVPLQVGFQRRFDEGYMSAQTAMRQGQIGRLYNLRFVSTDSAPPPASYEGSAGDIFADLQIHDFDALRWLSGQTPTRVFAVAQTLINGGGSQNMLPDNVTTIVELESGATATLFAGRHNPVGYDARAEVLGSRGSITVGAGPRTPTTFVDGFGSREARAFESFIDRFASAYQAEISHFIQVAEGRKEIGCGWRDAYAAQVLAIAAAKSAQGEGPVNVADVPITGACDSYRPS